MPRRRPRKYMWKSERKIENQRRRAQLKQQLIKHSESTIKWERASIRWDWWSWD